MFAATARRLAATRVWAQQRGTDSLDSRGHPKPQERLLSVVAAWFWL